MSSVDSSRIPTEEQECEALHQWLELKGIPHTHIGNEGIGRGGVDFARTRKMKRMGQSKGFPDYLVVISRGPWCYCDEDADANDRRRLGFTGEWFDYGIIAIEMKRRKGGTISPDQEKWLQVLDNAGIESVVCRGFDEAKKFIEERSRI